MNQKAALSLRPPILTVAAVLVDGRGHTLLVRKRGSGVFIQPGGKREPGEAPEATLARELAEELGLVMVPGSARLLGEFEAEAVNEPGRRVRALAFHCAFEGEPRAQAEIEEWRWVPLQGPPGVPVAPLSARHILPAYRRAIGEGP
ncbi:MAG: DNA mismatch repair protein MutT [Silanimonas sp.]|nr:MAG: DNA mismatch repair protein MutT [Silanimonas sp.]